MHKHRKRIKIPKMHNAESVVKVKSMLLASQLLSLTAKIGVAVFLIRAYYISRRRSSFYLGIAWLISAVVILMDALGAGDEIVIFYALFSSVLAYGSLLFIIEERHFSLSPHKHWIWILPPIAGAIYGLILGNSWESRVGIPYGLSAFYVFLAGVTIASVETDFPTARIAGIALALFGIHEMDYPVLRRVEWFAPIGFTLGAFLTVLSAYFMARMVTSERFIKKRPTVTVEPGVMLINSREYGKILESLREYPVLAFLRKPVEFPAWKVYMITTVEEKMTVHPRNLAKMSELVSRYLNEANSKGVTGVVILDGLEFLIIHNGLQPVLRFLATLRDMAIVKRALLIVVLEEYSWNPKELAILRRVLEET